MSDDIRRRPTTVRFTQIACAQGVLYALDTAGQVWMRGAEIPEWVKLIPPLELR